MSVQGPKKNKDTEEPPLLTPKVGLLRCMLDWGLSKMIRLSVDQIFALENPC